MKIPSLFSCSLTLKTYLSPEEVMEKLATIVTTVEPGNFHRSGFYFLQDTEFAGRIIGNQFHVIRQISYKNSWLPEIKGQVAPADNGSRVLLNIFVHPLVQIFSYFFLFITGAISTIVLTSDFSNESLGVFIPIVLFIFFLTMSLGAFWTESSIAIKIFKNKLEATASNG